MAERKKFIEVKIPILETTVRVLGTIKDLNGKTIQLDLSRKLRGRGLTVTFQIFEDNKELLAIPKKMELVKSYIRKMLRKRISYVEDSYLANCKDIRATVKPFLITRKRVSRAVRKNLRNTCKEFLTEYLKEVDYNDACESILNGTLQKEMLPKLKKVYPLSFCDIRIFETKELEKIKIDKISNENIVKEIKDKEHFGQNEPNEKEIDEEKEVKKTVKKKK